MLKDDSLMKRVLFCCLLALTGFFASIFPSDFTLHLSGIVVDENGNPVTNAVVYSHPRFEDGKMFDLRSVRTNAFGEFRLRVDLWEKEEKVSLFARNSARTHGAFHVVDSELRSRERITMTLRKLHPLRVRYKFDLPDAKPYWTHTEVMELNTHLYLTSYSTYRTEDKLWLPEGEYEFFSFSTDEYGAAGKSRDWTEKVDSTNRSTKQLVVPHSRLTELYGKPAPAISYAQAIHLRGERPPRVELGKWTLLVFWDRG